MKGIVRFSEACVEVVFRLPNRPDLALEFVVDTGFAGALTLPVAAVEALGLPYHQPIEANLADGTNVKARVHLAVIVDTDFEPAERTVAVIALGNRPLLGTARLEGCDLSVRYIENGAVEIKPIRS